MNLIEGLYDRWREHWSCNDRMTVQKVLLISNSTLHGSDGTGSR